jgi:hypothetical protein
MNRPRQHILETISKKALEQIIPDEWVVRPLDPDYGIDFMVEVFKSGKSTGDFFYIQLKGTDQKVKKSKIKVAVKYSTLQYFSTLPLPILFLVYSTRDKKFRGLWINEYNRIIKSKSKQKTVTLTLTDQHLIDRDLILRIEKSIRNIKKININIKAKHNISTKYHARLREYIDYYYPDLFVYDQNYFPLNISFNYVHSANNLFIEVDYNLLGKYKLKKLPIKNDSDFLIYQSIYENISAELQEAMFLIAIFASRLNIVASLKVLGKILPFYDGKYNTPTTIADIGLIAFDNHKLLELQQLIDILINYKKYNEFQYLMVMFLAQMREPLPKLKEFYRQNLLRVIT